MKNYCDYHIHSTLSLDGISTMAEQVAACRAAGVTKVCFTEHIDYDCNGRDFMVGFERYQKSIEEVRAQFPDMHILMGLELGDTTRDRAKVVELSNALPLDFKLLSRHQVDGVDPYMGDKFFEHRTRAQAAHDYCEAVYRTVTLFPDYDAVAHIGYVFKFATGDGFPPLRWQDEPDLLDGTLRFMAEHGKALEINTSRFIKFGDGMPGVDILKRFRELGGEFVTLGSDSHQVDTVAQGFDEVTERIKACGFDYLATYEQRKRVMWKL